MFFFSSYFNQNYSMSLLRKLCEPWQKIRTCFSYSAKRRRMETKVCSCSNCHRLPEYTECDVCMNPLQGSKIGSCPVCANLVCENCATKLNKCAFCRTEKPLERNRAVERLLENLLLPCKNFRAGCKILLTCETRTFHEKYCNFGTEECILDLACRWSGPMMSMQSHFRDAHNLVVTNDNVIKININRFQQKSLAKTGTQYVGCLKCYDQLFFFKVVIYKQQLRIYFCRVGYLCGMTLQDVQTVFKMIIVIQGSNGVEESGMCSFENTNCRNLKSIKIFCKNFYKNCQAADENDRTQVSLCIKKTVKRPAKVRTLQIDTDVEN